MQETFDEFREFTLTLASGGGYNRREGCLCSLGENLLHGAGKIKEKRT